MQKIGLKIGGCITLTALDTQETLIPMGYLHGRKLYVGKYPKISEEDNSYSFRFPVGSVVSDYRNYVKNKQVEVEITSGGKARWYRVAFCEELSILSENCCTSMMEMSDDAEPDADTDTDRSRYAPMEDYSEYLEVSENSKYGNRCLKWRNCNNANWILQHHLPQLDRCGVIDISCCNISKAENIRNARIIREVLHEHGYKPYLVAGHWNAGEPPYSAERAYIVEAAYGETPEYFMSLIRQCLERTGNTDVMAVVQWTDEGIGYNARTESYWRSSGAVFRVSGYVMSACGKSVSVHHTGLATTYSHVVKKRSDSFRFDGMELPGSNSGRLTFHRLGISYDAPPEPDAHGIRRLKITRH